MDKIFHLSPKVALASFISLLLGKYYNQKQLMEESVYFRLQHRQECNPGAWRQEVKQKSLSPTVYWSVPHGLLNLLFHITHQHMYPFSKKTSSSPEVFLHPPLHKVGGTMVNKVSTIKEITQMRS